MYNTHPRYLCYPSVLCVGKETEVTVFPCDISRQFREDAEYALGIVGLLDDQEHYYNHVPLDHPFSIVDGCLRFTFTAKTEQEFSVRFCEKGGKEVKIALYAVEEDLYALRPLKGDLHVHSYYSDGQDGLAMVPAYYREAGFDFFALTDHNRMFPSELAADLYDGIPLGIHMIKGEETHPPESVLHIVGIGHRNCVSNTYIHELETYEAEIDRTEATLSHIPEQYRRRVAMAKWACDNIRRGGGLAILPHPFWMPNCYNLSEELMHILFEEKLFDAFELMGGVNFKSGNLQLALWQEESAKGNRLPVVGSSDSHTHDFTTGKFARNFTVVFAKDNTTEAIAEAIRSGYSVAAEIPSGDNFEIRFYNAQYRLIAFAHFLHEHYFNETWRLCIGEGVLMRRYAQGEAVGELLASFSNTVSDFYKRFYGFLPAPVLPEERRRYLALCRERQINEGPNSSGSVIGPRGKNPPRL